jgi:hypothetical protein
VDELDDKEFEKQISLNYGRVIFLYFKALLLSDDYRQQVDLANKASNEAQLAEAKSTYPYFDRIHLFFDDVYQFGNSNTNKDITEAFDKFIVQRGAYFDIPFTHRIEFITDGESIKPEAGTTYVTLPGPANIPLATELYSEAYEDVPASTNVALASLFPPMDGFYVYALDDSTLDITARRLDAFVWLSKEGLDAEAAVHKAYESASSHWAGLRETLEEAALPAGSGDVEFDQQDLSRYKKELERDSEQGTKVIANVIKGIFPSSK